MNQLGFLPLVLLIAWPTSIIKKYESLTSERSFSTLRRLKTHPRNTMMWDRSNGCMLVHCHKTLADTIDHVAIAKMFASANEQRKEHACWKVQVNVDSTKRGRLLLLIEGGGRGAKKNGMSNFIFSPTTPLPSPSPTFYLSPPPLASQNFFTYYELERSDYGQLIDRKLIPKVHVFFYMPIFLKS